MPYTPTSWVDSTSPVNAANMNKIEAQLVATETAKGAANGYASLDSGGKIPSAQLPSGIYVPLSSVAAASGVASLDSGTKVPVAQIPDLSATYQVKSEKAAASGYASLDSGGKVPTAQLPVISPITYRKTTAKTVNTTVTATDLLNGEITIAANALGATGLLKLTAFGDYLNNSGSSINLPRFQLIFGGTTLIDTNTGPNFTAQATRFPWKIEALIFNTATGAQVVYFNAVGASSVSAASTTALTTGEGAYFGGAGSFLEIEGYNTSSVDTTAAKTLVLNVINGSAAATVETKLVAALAQVL